MTKSVTDLFKVGLVLFFTLLTQGCKKEEITAYEVNRLDPPERNSTTGEPVRLLAAIFSKGDSTWFFKLMGPASKLSTKTEEFETFVRTVRFGAEGSTPPIQWNAPSNWKAGKTNELRYATFLIDPEANPKLELTVIKLGKDAGSILANINRWREQVGLGPVSEGDLPTIIKKETIQGVEAILADYSGPGGKKGAMTPPFAKSFPKMPVNPSANQASPGVKEFKKPDTWEQVPNSAMSLATFKVNEAAGKADITLTPLAGPAGGLESNINRWRQQVGLAPQSPEMITSSLTKLQTKSSVALCIDIEGSTDRILGAVISTPDTTWFVKMKGPNTVVKMQKQSFESFVSSLQFADGAK
ncbi:MAG: hypothetical protein WCN64_10540 [Planctomycetota bacterium]